MKHMVITIGCEYGCGGPEIGKMLSEALDIDYYDRDLVDKVVEKIGIDRNLVEKADTEANVEYCFDTKSGPHYANLTNRVISIQFDVIRNIADKASCVIVGRSSNYILKDRDDVLNIFIYAPEKVRIKTVMEQQQVSEEEAAEIIKYNDNMLHSRYKYITGTHRGNRRIRHMMIDSSTLGWEQTAQYILKLIEMKFGEA